MKTKKIFGGEYTVYSDGKVFSNKSNIFMKQFKSGSGYLMMELYHKNTPIRKQVHRIVLETFLGKCPKSMQGCHLDGNKLNNDLSNLKWATVLENNHHKIKHGTMLYGEKNPRARFTESQINKMRELFHNGVSQAKISRIFRTADSTVSDIVRMKRWKHLAKFYKKEKE